MILFSSKKAKALFSDYSKDVALIEKCTYCGGDIEVDESGIVRCVNPDCVKKIEHKISNMLDILEVKGAGPAFISNAAKDAKSLSEFLSKLDSKAVEWAGGINGEKIKSKVSAIVKKQDLPPHKFLALFDMPGFGQRRLEMIEDAISIDFSSQRVLIDKEKVINTDGWTEASYVKLMDALLNSSLEEDIKNCLSIFNISKKSDEKAVEGGKLSGLSFCFTGKAEAIGTRKECEALVIKNGGKIANVTKSLSYLVNDDTSSTSSKNLKAISLGVKIISSYDFLKMCQQ